MVLLEATALSVSDNGTTTLLRHSPCFSTTSIDNYLWLIIAALLSYWCCGCESLSASEHPTMERSFTHLRNRLVN